MRQFIRVVSLALASCAASALASTANAQVYSLLHNFEKGHNDGHTPLAHLVENKSNHVLYGTTEKGGAFGYGAIFEAKKNARGVWSEKLLYSFPGGQEGAFPKSGLTLVSSDLMYGTTEAGGSKNEGIVYALRLRNGVWYASVIHNFAGGSDGSHPYADLIQSSSTKTLYGTTYEGGSDNCGVVYQLVPANGSWTESVIYTFGGSGGCNPQVSLRQDTLGDLYGTTLNGGAYNYGEVFMLTPDNNSWTQTVLHSFEGGSDGQYGGALDISTAGILFGTTYSGGTYNMGTAYELEKSGDSWLKSTIYNFEGNSDGYSPTGLHLNGQTGALYGTTEYGGTENFGTVYELTPHGSSWTKATLHSFTGEPYDGSYPDTGGAYDINRNALYGTTTEGGKQNVGTIYKIGL